MADFTVGQDCQVAVTGPFGEVEAALQTKFSVKQVTSNPNAKVLDGTRKSRTVFDCWTGSLTIVRDDATFDNFAQSIQQSCLSGTPVPDGTILYQIHEQNGTTTQWQLTQVTFQVADLGDYAADAAVTQTLTFQAQQRQPA